MRDTIVCFEGVRCSAKSIGDTENRMCEAKGAYDKSKEGGMDQAERTVGRLRRG